jgi:AcrR family transcriptional regulator
MKLPLSRDAIVTEALLQLTREGLEGMSLRKVAAALATGPASLYAYIENLDELQALVLDRALGSVDLRGARKGGWRDRLVALLESYLHVLSRSPGLAQLALGAAAVGPSALRIVETLLGLLDEAGVDRGTAALAVDLLLLYVTGIAAEQSKNFEPTDPEGAVARAIRGVSADDYPRIHAAREEMLSGGEERFVWAIDVLLRGILQTSRSPTASLAPAPAPSSPSKEARSRTKRSLAR